MFDNWVFFVNYFDVWWCFVEVFVWFELIEILGEVVFELKLKG